jgi:type I restriction enzyme S subunit
MTLSLFELATIRASRIVQPCGNSYRNQMVSLREICRHTNGIQTGPFGSQLHAHEYQTQGIPVIMPRDLVDGGISEAVIARISPEVSQRLSRHRVEVGDIVLARRGEIGRCALIKPENAGWLCGTGCLRVRLVGDVLPEFVFRLIAAEENTRWLQQNAVGATMLNLSATILGRLPLSLPPLPEQRRIVEILDEADAAVRMTEALIAAKLKHKRAWAEQLLTGNARFPEFAGEVWHETKLGTVLRESRTPAKTSHPGARLTVRLHTEGVEARKDRGTEVEEATVYYERRAGQLIYGKQNLHRGAVGIIPERLDGYSSSQDVPAFDWQPSGDPDFFLHYFSWKPFYERLERLATGTGSKRIHPAAFLSVSLHIPALAEQQKIAEVLSLMDEEIALRRRQLTALKAQKQGLMQKLLTGEVRVKEFAP